MKMAQSIYVNQRLCARWKGFKGTRDGGKDSRMRADKPLTKLVTNSLEANEFFLKLAFDLLYFGASPT